MTNNFNWQTEEDANWDELLPADSDQKPPRKQRRWLYIVVILVLLIGVGYAIWQQVQQRVDENTTAMRADIVSSYKLLQHAANEQDHELFISLLSGRDSNWTEAQNDLFHAGLLIDRSPLNLPAEPLPELALDDEENLQIEFSSDLLSAEVTTKQPYSVNVGNNVDQTVILLQTSIYRLGRERWLYSPPEPEFWGEEITHSGSFLTLTTPERDSELAGRLRVSLEQKLQEMCQTLDTALCPDGLRVVVNFSTDPAVLTDTAVPLPVTTSENTLSVRLPTPTLVGAPVDDAGYQALFRAYGTQLVTAVLTNLLNYPCCENAPLHRALIDYQLSELALKVWPVTESDYQNLLTERIRIENLLPLVRGNDWAESTWETAWPAYVLVDFLRSAYPETSAASMQKYLQNSANLFSWLELVEGGQQTARADLVSDINRELWLRAYLNQLQINGAPPLPLPGQALHLLCTTGDPTDGSQTTTLHTYQPERESWDSSFQSSGFIFLSPLPDDNAVILQEIRSDEESLHTILWKNGAGTTMLPNLEQYSVSFGQTDPGGDLLTTFTFNANNDSADIVAFRLDACGENGCESQILPSIPIWSPDGTLSLFSEDPNKQLSLLQMDHRIVLFDPSQRDYNYELYRSEREDLFQPEPIISVKDLLPVGQGFAPFWLNENSYGYLQPYANGSSSRLIVANSSNSSETIVLQSDDLLAALPQDVTAETLFIRYVLPHPTDPQRLFIVAFHRPTSKAHVFSFNLATEEILWHLQAGYEVNHALSVSPDGRFLALLGNDAQRVLNPDNQSDVLQIYAVEQNRSLPFPTIAPGFAPISTIDWSADGNWAALLMDNDILALYAPEYDYLQIIPLNFGDCSSPAWINSPGNN